MKHSIRKTVLCIERFFFDKYKSVSDPSDRGIGLGQKPANNGRAVSAAPAAKKALLLLKINFIFSVPGCISLAVSVFLQGLLFLLFPFRRAKSAGPENRDSDDGLRRPKIGLPKKAACVCAYQ